MIAVQPGDMCAICGQREARFWSNAVLWPLTLRITGYCAPCNEADFAVKEAKGGDRDAEYTPAEIEAQLMALGPIDFTLLAQQLPSAAPTVGEGADDLRFVADSVRQIAAHHGQPLPHDIAAFVARHGSTVPPAS